MIYFNSDYLEGAHPAIMEKLVQTNMEQTIGYSCDEYCEAAREKIKLACQAPDADVHFLVGGTQTNTTVISSILRPYQGVLTAVSGHINCHETGAIESTGHKVIALDTDNGKITAKQVEDYYLWQQNDESVEHIVQPGMVYISHPTEYGTLYTKAELETLSDICHEYGMTLYMDGARLGYGLMCEESDLTLPDVASLCDVFYIGGTKVGTLCGEAVVFTNGKPTHFLSHAKQHGALLAKGRLVGVQFDALFSDGLYFEISRHAIAMANALKAAFLEKGYTLFIDSPTNQQFVILPNDVLARLKEEVAFSVWQPLDEQHTVARFVTSWATDPQSIAALSELL